MACGVNGVSANVGHREGLLRAAKACVLRRGYARTTARDLVAESGANLASIAYHFGSKDALLTEALIALNDEWGAELFRVLSDAPAGADPAAQEAHEIALWERVIASIRQNRALWGLNFESVQFVLNDDRIREINTEAQRRARPALARAFAGPELDDDALQTLGSHYYALLVGVALQWITDPGTAPDAATIVRAEGGRRSVSR